MNYYTAMKSHIVEWYLDGKMLGYIFKLKNQIVKSYTLDIIWGEDI